MARHRAALADGEVETIDMDGALPGGHVDDTHAHAAASGPASPPLTAEQRKIRLQVVTFKHSLEGFEVTDPLSRVGISDIKRGDVIAIETIVGQLYLQIIDRIKGVRKDTGEILCECHYDLHEQNIPKHAASIQLPICSKNFIITNPDGSTRLASRKLKMSTDAELPLHVSNLLDERFFGSLAIHASPQPDKLRPIDLARWFIRMALRFKALIDEHNRLEREKQARKEEQRQQKKAARQQAIEAKKNKR
ncbi:hypothetical protein [Dechloromonas sp. A34]|uniref:hypothetical protein n=1 Tax=Dechloromonas sp. A34 TaxID=447588 RepID=UPI00224954B0|nr:hypothetical protein [Dechloromonas sp. A34]